MKRVFIAAALVAWAMPLAAHHGKDFLIVESYELPQPRAIYFVSSELFSRSTFTSEPSLLFGVTNRFAGEVHVHMSRDGYEAIAPAVHLQLISAGPWSIGASAEYEFARRSENAFAGRLIASHALGEGQVVVNAGVDDKRAAYAIGFRPEMEARTSWGIEAQGRFEHGEEHQAIIGIYTQPNERFTFKAGAGVGYGTGRATAVVRTGIVWRF